MPYTARTGCLLVIVVSMVACTEATSESTTTTQALGTTSIAPAEMESSVFEVVSVATHPNGAQLRVDRIEVLADSVVVSGVITNGSPFGIVIGRGTAELASTSGQTSGLLEPFPVSGLPPAEELDFSFRFAPLDEPSGVTLRVNQGGGSSPTNPTATIPAFEIGPIPLDPSATRPSIPEPIPVSRVTIDSIGSGIELRVEGVNLTENRIGVWVRISNPLGVEARISPTIAPSLIEDDLGNRYPLVLPEDQGWISIPAASARSGALSFAGRIHPNARSLSIGLNAGTNVHQHQGRVYPEFIVLAITLDGDSELSALPFPVADQSTLAHPAGVSATAKGLVFTEAGTEVPVEIVNERTASVTLAAAATALTDDLGNRYLLTPLLDNPRLILDPGTTIEATLVFSGRIAGDATSVSIMFNPGRSASDPETRQPAFEFGPFDLARPQSPAEPVEARVFAVPPRSRLVEDQLAVSQVDRISQALTQFDATVIDGGFQLTLPDTILFDFGSSQLRPDARQALALIAEILEYFDNEQVIVVGHTDSVGNASTNQRLSEQRAGNVVQALVGDHGVSASRLTAEGRGSTEPMAPNTAPSGEDNPEGRQLNRRVEILVITDRALPGS